MLTELLFSLVLTTLLIKNMKKLLFLFTLIVSKSVFAQKTINDYKYIVVPNQFEFVKSPDKYRTSSLTKFLFNKHGFTAFLSDEMLPEDLQENRCLALTADVKDASGMFTTKNIIELKDCGNRIIYTSTEGKSKIKDYKKAYHEAIREAFNAIKKLNYKYIPSKGFKEVQSEVVETIVKKKVVKLADNELFAQPKENGFQLINTKPEIVFELLNTYVKDVFIIKNKNGILYKSNDVWTAEYYKNNTKVVEEYKVKF